MLSRANPACGFLLPCVKLVFIDHFSFGIRTFKSGHQSGLDFLCNQLGLFILFHTDAMGLTLLLNNSLVEVHCPPQLLRMILFSPNQMKKPRKPTNSVAACLVVL